MDPMLKDWLQAVAWIGGVVTAIVALVKLVSESRSNREQREREREQRERELRWKQAEAGKGLNDEMQTDPRAWPALQMLDDEGREFEIDGERRQITRRDIESALAQDSKVDDALGRYIRDAFDTLFYFFAVLDHYIDRKLILPEDVAYPLEYYVPRLSRSKRVVQAYLDRYKLTRAVRYLERFDSWRDAPAARAAEAALTPELMVDPRAKAAQSQPVDLRPR